MIVDDIDNAVLPLLYAQFKSLQRCTEANFRHAATDEHYLCPAEANRPYVQRAGSVARLDRFGRSAQPAAEQHQQHERDHQQHHR